jgi:putative membrane protein
VTDGAPADPADPDPQGEAEWHHMHPLTPVVRSWRVLVVMLVFIAQGWGQEAMQGGGSAIPDVGRNLDVGLLGGGAVVFLLLVAIGAGYSVLSWRMTRYRITQDALELHTGVLFRQQRRARLDRLQAVDVVQPFVARIAGLSQLTLEVAGGAGSSVALSYLSEERAVSLRGHLLARAAGVSYDTEEAPQAPERPVLEVPFPRLAGSLALSGPAISATLLLLGLLVSVAALRSAAPLAALVPTSIGVASVLWTRFNGSFHFRVAASPDGLRLRHGLLEQRAQTVPPGRVQAVRLAQPLLWRRLDWWSVRVNVAGYGGTSENQESTESVLLPVGTRDEAVGLLALVLPDLGVSPPEHPRAVVDAGLQGFGERAGFVTSPASARWLDPWAWRRTGFRVTDQALLLRRGRFRRHLDVVPHARTQSCALAQGPLQRRLGLVTFALHSTPGPVRPVLPHLAGDVGARLLDEQADRARRARSAAGPERWMEHLAAGGPGPDLQESADLEEPFDAGGPAQDVSRP